jgi:hypothetical protein
MQHREPRPRRHGVEHEPNGRGMLDREVVAGAFDEHDMRDLRRQ